MAENGIEAYAFAPDFRAEVALIKWLVPRLNDHNGLRSTWWSLMKSWADAIADWRRYAKANSIAFGDGKEQEIYLRDVWHFGNERSQAQMRSTYRLLTANEPFLTRLERWVVGNLVWKQAGWGEPGWHGEVGLVMHQCIVFTSKSMQDGEALSLAYLQAFFPSPDKDQEILFFIENK